MRERRIIPLATWELAEEIAEALRRPELRRYRIGEADIVDILATLALFLPTITVAADRHGPNDKAMLALGVAGRADAFISEDRDLLDNAGFEVVLAERRITLITSAQALERLAADGRR